MGAESLGSWRSRRYLPHFEGNALPQAVIFRLADALPRAILDAWSDELARLPERQAAVEHSRRVEACLDRGMGSSWLRDLRIAGVVEDALLQFDGDRYDLHAWVIMPNHVHVLFTPLSGYGLAVIVGSWKSYTAKVANRLLGRSGEFWQREYFDRCIRSARHFQDAVTYIEENPVAAGLCAEPSAWGYGSARLARMFECDGAGSEIRARTGETPALPGGGSVQ